MVQGISCYVTYVGGSSFRRTKNVVILDRMIAAQLIEKFSVFYGSEGSLQCLHQPTALMS